MKTNITLPVEVYEQMDQWFGLMKEFNTYVQQHAGPYTSSEEALNTALYLKQCLKDLKIKQRILRNLQSIPLVYQHRGVKYEYFTSIRKKGYSPLEYSTATDGVQYRNSESILLNAVMFQAFSQFRLYRSLPSQQAIQFLTFLTYKVAMLSFSFNFVKVIELPGNETAQTTYILEHIYPSIDVFNRVTDEVYKHMEQDKNTFIATNLQNKPQLIIKEELEETVVEPNRLNDKELLEKAIDSFDHTPTTMELAEHLQMTSTERKKLTKYLKKFQLEDKVAKLRYRK